MREPKFENVVLCQPGETYKGGSNIKNCVNHILLKTILNRGTIGLLKFTWYVFF